MTTDSLTPQEARNQLYDIIREDVPFEEKARRALALGRDYLDADYGYLTRIDTETDHWETMVSTEPPGGEIPEGLEADLGTTYCRRTMAAEEQIVLHDVPNQGWADDVAFETYGLHCYVGTRMLLDGDPYGTVCFSAEKPRSEPFSEGETMFAELISRLLERELEREQHEAQLTRQTNLALVLNRVLRHNLRNDLAVIRGYTQMMAEELDEDRYADIALRYIDELIELSGKARDLDEIVGGDVERHQLDLGSLVEQVVGRVRQAYPSASFTVETAGDCTVTALPSLERALGELVENAAKHGGDAPSVTVTVEPVPGAVEIRIDDDGPGISEQEIAVLGSGVETPLTHGSGLGLWLTHWIVSSHDGSIEATATENGTTMTVTIPRSTETDIQRYTLTRARDQYKAAFEGTTEGVVMITDDAMIVDANPAASTIYGMEREALLGQRLQRFFPEAFDVDAEWLASHQQEDERDTVTTTAADGTERLVEYTVTLDIVPGEHLVVGRDVTVQAAERTELDRKTKAMDAAPVGITMSDPSQSDNPLIYVNDAFVELTGYRRDEILGENCRVLQGPETDTAPVREMREAIDAEEPVTVELTNYRKDGSPFSNRVTIAPVHDDEGQLVNYVGFQERLDDENTMD